MNKVLSSLFGGISLPFGFRLGRSTRMNRSLTMISGIGLGAGLMFILDPDRGARRRALILNQITHAFNEVGCAIGATSRDLSNRTRGLLAEIKHTFTDEEELTDEKLETRVRSKIGRVVSHPSAIEVVAHEGNVTLYGPILAKEVDKLISTVSSLRGVKNVEDQLEVHETAENVPDLQGGVERPGDRFELFQTNWSPSARLLTSIIGGTLGVYGLKRKDTVGSAIATLGIGLLVRGLTNIEAKRLISAALKIERYKALMKMKPSTETEKLPQDEAKKSREASAR